MLRPSQPAPSFAAAALFALLCGIAAQAQAAPGAPPPGETQPAPPSAKEGAGLFSRSGCTFCHGPQGAGTEKAPSLRDVRKRRSEDEIYRQIHDGGRMMPPFSDALSEGEIRSIVLFLKAEDGWALLPKDPQK